MTINRTAEIQAMARSLYETMPGTEGSPRDRGEILWGKIEHTRHWHHCETIARLIVEKTSPPPMKNCPKCEGTGDVPGNWFPDEKLPNLPCPNCTGTGRVRV